VSNTYQKTSRCAEPDPLLGEIIVPEQVIVSMTEIAGAARETCLALAGRHRPAGDGGHVRRGRDSAVRPGRQAQRHAGYSHGAEDGCPKPGPQASGGGVGLSQPSHGLVRRHRTRACVLDAGEMCVPKARLRCAEEVRIRPASGCRCARRVERFEKFHDLPVRLLYGPSGPMALVSSQPPSQLPEGPQSSDRHVTVVSG
jgi:hypothetical protein